MNLLKVKKHWRSTPSLPRSWFQPSSSTISKSQKNSISPTCLWRSKNVNDVLTEHSHFMAWSDANFFDGQGLENLLLGSQTHMAREVHATARIEKLDRIGCTVSNLGEHENYQIQRSKLLLFHLMSKSTVVRIADGSTCELPTIRWFHVSRFRFHDSEVWAGSKKLPFLFVCLIGLASDLKPDEDLLIQSALQLNQFQIFWRRIKLSFDRSAFNYQWIEELQWLAEV